MKTRFRLVALACGAAVAFGTSLTPSAVLAEGTMTSLGEHVAEQSQLSRSARASWDASTGVSKEAWASALNDSSVRYGGEGPAYIVEPRLSDAEALAGASRVAPVHTDISLGNAFSLHSRPGSLRTIFLDVNGHDVSGSAWDDNDTFGNSRNSRFIPGYNIEGRSKNYSNLERQNIIDAWSAVAEDYAMFDVDVTTETPSKLALNRSSDADSKFGVRVVISDEKNAIARWCGCGGVAFGGVFNHYAGKGGDQNSHSAYSPAFAFTRKSFGGKTISDIVSHEVGHTLGLSHDGGINELNGPVDAYYEGRDGWAPIMGAGYGQPLVQWSNGTYTSANNQENDIEVIASFGVDVLGDDHGDTAVEASPVALNSAEEGVIDSRTDVDFFRFIPLTVTVDVSVVLPSSSPNLDLSLVVTNSVGTTIATANPNFSAVSAREANGLSASVTLTNLTPGDTYYAALDGTGFGLGTTTGYSDFGSLGDYRIKVLGAPISPTSIPIISGSAKIGNTLIVDRGIWPAGVELSQTWLRNGSPIPEATGTNYKLTRPDRGKRITVQVAATKLGYSPATETSLPTAKVRR